MSLQELTPEETRETIADWEQAARRCRARGGLDMANRFAERADMLRRHGLGSDGWGWLQFRGEV